MDGHAKILDINHDATSMDFNYISTYNIGNLWTINFIVADNRLDFTTLARVEAVESAWNEYRVSTHNNIARTAPTKLQRIFKLASSTLQSKKICY
jgi:hypothetical protein